ncbi:hypothetical protein HDK64DRAFT_320082 [Phyllosticta capitalensis]
MSGAEFIAVIGIGASIVQLSEACHNVLVRIRQYRDHSAFLELSMQIRLFSKDVEALQDPRAQTGLDSDLTAAFIDLLGACRRNIQELEMLIECQIPQAESNSFKRISYAIRSLLKDRRLKGILDDLAIYQRTLTLHLMRATWNNQRDALQLLAAIERNTSTYSNAAPFRDQSTCNTPVPVKGIINVRDHSSAHRKPSRRSLCALGTCGCPCHINKTRLGILGFAGRSTNLLQCSCTRSDISFNMAGLRRLVEFKIITSWHDSLDVSFSLKYIRFVMDRSPGMALCGSFLNKPSYSPDYQAKTAFSDFMRLCCLGHVDLDDNTLIDWGLFRKMKFRGGYLEAALHLFGWREDMRLQNFALELATLLAKQGVGWKTSRPVDVLNVLMAYSITEDSRSKLRVFLRQAPSFEIEVGQLSVASRSLAIHWPKWKPQCRSEPWDPFYLNTIKGLVDCESGESPAYAYAFAIDSSRSQFWKLNSVVSGCLPALHLATLEGKVDEVSLLIENSDQMSLRQIDVWGHSVTHLAIQHPAILEYLITKTSREEIEREDFFGNTPLIYAVAYGKSSSIDLLLRHGADPFRASMPLDDGPIFPGQRGRDTNQHYDSWTFAALSGSIQSFTQLLDWYTPRASYEEVQEVIDRALRNYFRRDWRFRSSLPHQNDLDMLRFLVNIGARVGQIDDQGNSLLHNITLPEEALILLDGTEYSINHQNIFGCTALMALATTQVTEPSQMIQAIRRAGVKGACYKLFDNRGKMALHHLLAILKGSVRIPPRFGYEWPDLSFANPPTARSSILTAALMIQLGADTLHGDACTCACCPNGCSVFRYFFYHQRSVEEYCEYTRSQFRMCFEYTEELCSLPWLIELFLLLQQLGSINCGKEIAKVAFRLSAFELLEMTHTCCCDSFANISCRKYREYSIGDTSFLSRTYDSTSEAAVSEDLKEIEEEEHELAAQLERRYTAFAQGSEIDHQDTWIELVAQRVLGREDFAKSAFQLAPYVPTDVQAEVEKAKLMKSRIEKMFLSSLLTGLQETYPLISYHLNTASETYSSISSPQVPDTQHYLDPWRIESMVEPYMEACDHDYEGLADLLPEAESRRRLARERKEIVNKLVREVQRLRKTPPKERKWANIFEEPERTEPLSI